MNYSHDLASLLNATPENSIDSYHLSRIWTNFIYEAKKQKDIDLLLSIANSLNTRLSTLHSHQLNDFVLELKYVREFLLQHFIQDLSAEVVNTPPSSKSICLVVRNLVSTSDPEVQLTLGVILNSPKFNKLDIVVLGVLTEKVKSFLNLHTTIDINFVCLKHFFGNHNESISGVSIKRLVAIKRALLHSHDGYFVFLTDVSAKIGITSLLAYLLQSRSIFCYHSPISSGLENARWLFFGNTSPDIPEYCRPELIEIPTKVSNLNLSYYLPNVDTSLFRRKNKILKRLESTPFVFCCANSWKLIADELLLLNDILSTQKEILLVLAPFPPHYKNIDKDALHRLIMKYIEPRNIPRLVLFDSAVGHEGITWLVENSVFVLGTLLYPCISSMPICIKHKKVFISGIHETIRGMLCLQLESTVQNPKIFLVKTFEEYLSTVQDQLSLIGD